MTGRRFSLSCVILGALLVLAGLFVWSSGADLPIHRALRLGVTGSWPHRVVILSDLGGLAVLGPLALVAVALLFWRKRGADAAWLLATIVTGRLAVEGLKLLILRPRPPVADRLEIVQSWSFPSSHSAGTMMTCLALALLAKRRGWAIAAALVAAGTIGWSRVALAVHWPSDVLAGWGIGMAWIGLATLIRPSSAQPDIG